MAYKYALTGPPFTFQGHFSESQRDAFKSWVDLAVTDQPSYVEYHRIQAYRLRKSAGLLEKFYATQNSDVLAPTFQKESWQPGMYGHWAYNYREDLAPSIAIGQIKHHFRYALQRQEDGVFHMNHLRNQIERQEDLAQHATDAPTQVSKLMSKIDALFGKPEYEAVLVKDITDSYKGQPRFRVSPLDEPTQWELEQFNHGATPDAPLILGGQGS
jgi:hypothetical protein